jgi:hypothetical protein
MRRAATLTAVAVLVAVCSSGGALGSSPSRLIVLDRSIAGVTLLEQRSAVEKALGHGTSLGAPAPGVMLVAYRKGTLVVGYVTGGSKHETVALLLDTRSPRYRTRTGVGVGSSYAKLMSIGGVHCFGGMQCQHGYEAVNKPGTTFWLDRPRGSVIRIAMTLGH